MTQSNILRIFKQSFIDKVPSNDRRVGLSHLEFVCGLVFCFIGDTKTSSVEAMRRFMISAFETRISKSAFWERLSRPRLKNILHELLAALMAQLPSVTVIGEEILTQLKITSILLIDSSSMTLWDGAKASYPGTRTTAGIKWHLCFNLLSGTTAWFSLTPTSVHDRKCFPDINSLLGKLIIFDLGYWDYGLLNAINKAQGFFLSRVKSNAAIIITETVKGLGSRYIGEKLSSLTFERKRGKIIEFIGKISSEGESSCYRVIGFWNTTNKKYHWYITNLSVPSCVIYSLYRIRWQIELIFKGCKRSFNLDGRITSNNDNIIESLVLSSIIASCATQVVLNNGTKELTTQEQLAISYQRIKQVVVLLARDFISYLTSANHLGILANKIKLLSCEIYEKNHKHRPTSLQRLGAELECV